MTQANPFRKQVLSLLGEHYSDKTLVLCPTVFVRLLKGDHKAAILLSQILYWSDRTKDKEGWFYKSYADWQLETGLSEAQVRRILNGDKRVKTTQLTLRHLGVETKLRKVRSTGAPTLHYRINQAVFLATLDAFMGQGDSEQCAGSTTDDEQDEPSALPEMNTDQSQGTLIPSKTSSPDQQATDQDHQSDEDLLIFQPFESRFGKLKVEHVGTFRLAVEQLGATTVRTVLERCATRGRSWNYVMKALNSETIPSTPSETPSEGAKWGFEAFYTDEGLEQPQTSEKALLQASTRLDQTWYLEGRHNIRTVREIWDAAQHQFESQLGRDFCILCAELHLVDFVPHTSTFVIVVQTSTTREHLKHRFYRALCRILRDVGGVQVEIDFLLKEEWELSAKVQFSVA